MKHIYIRDQKQPHMITRNEVLAPLAPSPRMQTEKSVSRPMLATVLSVTGLKKKLSIRLNFEHMKMELSAPEMD